MLILDEFQEKGTGTTIFFNIIQEVVHGREMHQKKEAQQEKVYWLQILYVSQKDIQKRIG